MSLAQGRTAAATSCRRVLLFGVLPFVAGVWLVLVTFRHQGLPERLHVGQTLTLRQNCSQALGADGTACDCSGAAAGNGTAEGVLASRQAMACCTLNLFSKSSRHHSHIYQALRYKRARLYILQRCLLASKLALPLSLTVLLLWMLQLVSSRLDTGVY